MRVLLFTGKGGVGKTTVAAATAARAARAGHRTLILSTDPAHSLADSFEVPIGSEPTRIAENLWAQQVDAQERLEDNWREIQDYMVQLMNWAGTDTIQAEELTVIPGLDEIFALIDVKTHVESGTYDMLVVDCAPTAETLRLLSLPEIMNWYIERIFPVERRIVKTVRPLVSKVTTLPIAGDRVFDAVERLHRNLDAVKRILTDEAVSSVRLVLNPEKMVIAEARRTYTYLGLFGYRVDAVVVNRVLPPDVTDPYFGKWKDIQAEHLARSRRHRGAVQGRPDPRPQARHRLRAADASAVRQPRRHGYPSSRRGAVRPGGVVQAEPDPSPDAQADDRARGQLRGRSLGDPVRPRADARRPEVTMAEAASKKRPSAGSPNGKAAAKAAAADAGAGPHGPAAEHEAPVCTVGFCPICLAVTAIQPLRPDVIEHLLVAGREFLMAAKAVLDARADGVEGRDRDPATRLEKIDIG
jgi:arsenite-transporting ATPase